jgi:hypothetical protein
MAGNVDFNGGSSGITSADLLAANPRVLYVSTGGSDTTGDGSVAAPYASIHKALEVAESGTGTEWVIMLGVGEHEYDLSDYEEFPLTKEYTFQGFGRDVTTISFANGVGDVSEELLFAAMHDLALTTDGVSASQTSVAVTGDATGLRIGSGIPAFSAAGVAANIDATVGCTIAAGTANGIKMRGVNGSLSATFGYQIDMELSGATGTIAFDVATFVRLVVPNGAAIITWKSNRSASTIWDLSDVYIRDGGAFEEPAVRVISGIGFQGRAVLRNVIIETPRIPILWGHPSADSNLNTHDRHLEIYNSRLKHLHIAETGPDDVKTALAVYSRGSVTLHNVILECDASAATSTSNARAFQSAMFVSRVRSSGSCVFDVQDCRFKFNGTSTDTDERGAIVIGDGSGTVSGKIVNPTFDMGANRDHTIVGGANVFDVEGIITHIAASGDYSEETAQGGGGIVLPATLGTEGQALRATAVPRVMEWYTPESGAAPSPLYVTTSDYTFLETDSGAVALIPGTATAILTLPDDPVNGFELTLHAESGAGFRLDPGSSSYAEPIYVLGVDGSDPLTSSGGGSLYLKFNADLSKWVILPGSSGWVVWTP